MTSRHPPECGSAVSLPATATGAQTPVNQPDRGQAAREPRGMPDDARPLTVEQVASLFGVGTSTVHDWISKGKLRAARPGRRYFISVASVRALLAGMA